MNQNEYLSRAFNLYNSGQISAEAYDAMVMNADQFCGEDEGESEILGLPRTYAEIDYSDLSTPEAIAGCRFDDMNYRRYMER